MPNALTVSASVKTVSNRMDPVALTLTSAELNRIFVEITLAVSTLPAHSDVNVCPVTWEHRREFNAKHRVKMLYAVNMPIVNQMVRKPIVSAKKVGRIIPKILLPVALRSMNVTHLENALVRQALLVRFSRCLSFFCCSKMLLLLLHSQEIHRPSVSTLTNV